MLAIIRVLGSQKAIAAIGSLVLIASAVAAEDAVTVPAEIQQKGLAIGGEFAYPPQAFYKDGTLVGVDIELATAVAKSLGVKVNFINLPFETLIPSLKSKRINAAWSAMYDTKERQQTIDLVDYYSAPWGLLTKQGNPLKLAEMGDLCGARAALSSGSASVDMVQAQSKKCEAEGKKPVQIDVFKDDPSANLAIRSGRADFNLQDFATMAYIERATDEGKIYDAVVVEDLSRTLYGVGFDKSQTEARDFIVSGLNKIIESGEYTAILRKWGLEAGALERVTVNGGH